MTFGQPIDKLLIKVALELDNSGMKQKMLLIWHNVDYSRELTNYVLRNPEVLLKLGIL